MKCLKTLKLSWHKPITLFTSFCSKIRVQNNYFHFRQMLMNNNLNKSKLGRKKSSIILKVRTYLCNFFKGNINVNGLHSFFMITTTKSEKLF